MCEGVGMCLEVSRMREEDADAEACGSGGDWGNDHAAIDVFDWRPGNEAEAGAAIIVRCVP